MTRENKTFDRIEATGIFDPLLFCRSLLRSNGIVTEEEFHIGSETVRDDLIESELDWVGLSADREKLVVFSKHKPDRVLSLFTNCLRWQSHIPILSVAIERSVHMSAGSSASIQKIIHSFLSTAASKLISSDDKTVEPKTFKWEQKFAEANDFKGYTGFEIGRSLRILPHGVGFYVSATNHFFIGTDEKPSNGNRAAEIVSEGWKNCADKVQVLIERMMSFKK